MLRKLGLQWPQDLQGKVARYAEGCWPARCCACSDCNGLKACRARDGTGHKLECSKISVDEVQGAEEDGGVGDPAVGPGGGPARLASLAKVYWGMITTATEDFNTCISRQIKDLAGDVGHCDMRVLLYQLPFN